MRDYWRGVWTGIFVGLGFAAFLVIIWDSLWGK
jgi:hypothetical protein